MREKLGLSAVIAAIGTTVLVQIPASPSSAAMSQAWYKYPSVSSDGRWIAVSRHNVQTMDYGPDLVLQDQLDGRVITVPSPSGVALPSQVCAGFEWRISCQTGIRSAISDEGTYVAFEFGDSLALYDAEEGVSRVLLPSGAGGHSPSISGDGRHIAFISDSPNLVPNDTNAADDVFVIDRVTQSVVRASVTPNAQNPNGASSDPSISGNGRFVAFTSVATNLVASDSNQKPDVFRRDLTTSTTLRASLTSTGTQSDARSDGPSISNDGRYVAFSSIATNLVPNDPNGGADAFLRDMSMGTTRRMWSAENHHFTTLQTSLSGNGALLVIEGKQVIEIATGETETLADPSGLSGVDGTSSDDGSIVAFIIEDFDRSTLWVQDRLSGVLMRDPSDIPGERTYDDYNDLNTQLDPLALSNVETGPQWALWKIRAPQAWREVNGQGAGVRVAVIDSGVDLQHEDLQCAGKLEVVPGSDLVGDGNGPDDVLGHGTHVAGVLGSCTDNGWGIAGVAPRATILPFQVFDSRGEASFLKVAQAIRLASDSGAHVINLSLQPAIGPLSYVPDLFREVDAAVKYAVDNGVVVVAADGNDSMPICEYPALVQDVICVGATDERDRKTWYSTLPNKMDGTRPGPGIVAPGGTDTVACIPVPRLASNQPSSVADTILSLFPRELDQCDDGRTGYTAKSGTSAAAPHVSGVAALVYARLGGVRTEATGALARQIVVETADDLGVPGYDPIYGYGRVNAQRAVRLTKYL